MGDYWIINLLDRRLEVYCDPIADNAAPFGWRYGRSAVLGPTESVSPLSAPAAMITVADLLT
ncbi:MAG: hypothetical protein C5B48_04510 [Candidatus Rokuibacteriota bacterium]|nr:MAG: hypothetical protein C5B48_04510 [Candidatus Rokubacteria bacterium]